MKKIPAILFIGFFSIVNSLAMGRGPDEQENFDKNGGFDEKKSWEDASLVVVGTLTNIVKHQQNNDPSRFDFIEFDFNVQKCEKGKIKGPLITHLRIFPSTMEWPSDTEGLFRAYIYKAILYNKPYKDDRGTFSTNQLS
ncbi:MAG: hypothetical protein JNK54_09340 [Elusimicrobia bacterium]|nr:hypothetical protein [Elusimicrobiota bacterium]